MKETNSFNWSKKMSEGSTKFLIEMWKHANGQGFPSVSTILTAHNKFCIRTRRILSTPM